MTTWLYAGFIALVIVMLLIDLLVISKKDKPVSAKRSLAFTGVTILMALAFSGAIWWMYGNHWLGIGLNVPQLTGDPKDVDAATATVQFLTGYLIEYSLSLDNIFVIAVVFAHFKIPDKYQHRVLFWGVMGALIMRGVMIFAGAGLIQQFHWVIYVMGAFLLFTGLKMLISKDEHEPELENNWTVKLARKLFPVTPTLHGEHFFVVEAGKRMATPLFLTLIVVEGTDAIFAVDSIPAIFGVTLDPFIVFTSNVFAILGLRSLYFAIAGMMKNFRFLKPSLALVLMFVGAKMVLGAFNVHVPQLLSLGVIIGLLVGGVVASLMIKPKPGV
jgi:tellurite resistance protein TerC